MFQSFSFRRYFLNTTKSTLSSNRNLSFSANGSNKSKFILSASAVAVLNLNLHHGQISHGLTEHIFVSQFLCSSRRYSNRSFCIWNFTCSLPICCFPKFCGYAKLTVKLHLDHRVSVYMTYKLSNGHWNLLEYLVI